MSDRLQALLLQRHTPVRLLARPSWQFFCVYNFGKLFSVKTKIKKQLSVSIALVFGFTAKKRKDTNDLFYLISGLLLLQRKSSFCYWRRIRDRLHNS